MFGLHDAPSAGAASSGDIVSQMGILSAVRTGHAPTDLMLALILPMVFKLIISAIQFILPLVQEACVGFLARDKNWPQRTIKL